MSMTGALARGGALVGERVRLVVAVEEHEEPNEPRAGLGAAGLQLERGAVVRLGALGLVLLVVRGELHVDLVQLLGRDLGLVVALGDGLLVEGLGCREVALPIGPRGAALVERGGAAQGEQEAAERPHPPVALADERPAAAGHWCRARNSLPFHV
jgi:hypothetical protein